MKKSYIIDQIKKLRFKPVKKPINMIQQVNEALYAFIKEAVTKNFTISNIIFSYSKSDLAFDFLTQTFHLSISLPVTTQNSVAIKTYQIVRDASIEIPDLELTVYTDANGSNVMFNIQKTFLDNQRQNQAFQVIPGGLPLFATYYLHQLKKYLMKLP